MRALTITAVSLNILLALFVLLGIARVLPSGGQSLAALVMVLLAVGLTIFALQTRPDASGVYVGWQRVVRLAAWMLHVPIFLLSLLLVFIGKSFWPLLLALPPVTVFLVLLRNPAFSGGVKRQKRKGETAEDIANRAAQLRAHYVLHETEIRAMAQEFKRLLIEKYGMREDYVAKLEIENSVAPDVPVATAWHLEGYTPAEMANRLIDIYHFSSHANNPAIFSKHLDTGEDLPADYQYDHWAHRYFGRTGGQKLASVIIILLVLSCLYGIYFGTFFSSAAWSQLALGISVALSIALCVRFLRQMKEGRLRSHPNGRRFGKGDVLWLGPLCTVLLWWSIEHGIGLPATALFGTPHEAVYAYKKNAGKPCLWIDAPAFSLSRFCLARDVYHRLPETGTATFKGKKSWFGKRVEEMKR